tara:strand:- start:1988 stop:3151 length:1164 start_codon:yes stop_codon:yes gene_type:complete
MRQKISIIGSTGSIGDTVFKIIDKEKKYFKLNLLSANKNYLKIYHQIKKYKPNYFVVNDKKIFEKLKKKIFKETIILNNFNFKKIKKSDLTISAIPGISGLQPTLNMIKVSKRILIANKESIICGWNLIKKTSDKFKTSITPVDSEHFSLLQLLKNHNLNEIKKIYLTASGGPFLKFKPHQFKNINPKQALQHPKWKMGKKISVDSATLMNKMLELIEAQKLFNIPDNKIDILIHPESLVHAIIELNNGLSEFIYHDTTMLIPLANGIFEGKLNIKKFHNLNEKKTIKDLKFERVDKKVFPVFRIKNKLNEHPSSPIIINASNEVLVDHFLREKIPFKAIFKIIMSILNDRNYKKYAIRKPKNISQINKIDTWAKQRTIEKIIINYG